MSGYRNHGGIVRAIFKGGDKGPPAQALTCGAEGIPQAAVGRYAAGNTEIFDARLAGSFFQLVQQDGDDTALYRRTDVGQIGVDKFGIFGLLLLQEIKYGRFEAAKAEV